MKYLPQLIFSEGALRKPLALYNPGAENLKEPLDAF